MRAVHLTMVGLTLLAAAPAARAADYLGAEAALKQAQRQSAPENNPVGLLRAELDQFKQRSAQMPPDEAARDWLALADRHLALDVHALAQRGQSFKQPRFQEVVAALPPPAAWDALSAAIQAREPAPERRGLLDESWLLFAHLLKGDSASQWADVLRMRALLPKAPAPQKGMLAGQLPYLALNVAGASGDPDRILQAWELLTAAQSGQGSVRMPMLDLVRLVGPQKAESFLRRVLTTCPTLLSFQENNETWKLARKLALELVPRLRAPQWDLAASLDGAPLYEALEKRFPAGTTMPRGVHINGHTNPWDQQLAQEQVNARTYYMLSLVVTGRMTKALALAPALRMQNQGRYHNPTAFREVARGGHRKELLQFLRASLDKWPDLPLWQGYSELSLEAGQGEAVAQFCRQLLQRKRLTLATAQQVRERLVDALLALNRLNDAVTELRVLMRSPADPDEGEEPLTYAIRLARLGQVLKKPEWVREGLSATLAGSDGESPTIDGHLREVVPILRAVGRGPEAERLLISCLARQAQNERMQIGMPVESTTETLLMLTELYHRAGRHADVLALLEKATYWAAADLSEIRFMVGTEDLPAGYMAAAALAHAGRSGEASRILHALLLRRPEFDPAYELLAKLEGLSALPFLEQLCQHDRFEERPLIWKAYVLLNANRLEEAEKAVRAAIAIDPLDGEQQHGHRMRAYAVLADILQARGDGSQADLYRGHLRAIQISEEADRLVDAGLIHGGIQRYEEALGEFAEDYSIQARLALRLSEQARLQEAGEHFKRAFELMASGLGRIETPCRGCENLLTRSQAQAAAERVFTEQLAREPGQAQSHYLMGYLREQQGREVEACKHYQEAVRRDPDYLNAWRHLRDVAFGAQLAPTEQYQITDNLMRLDPLARYERIRVGTRGDLRRLWAAVESLSLSQPAAAYEKLMPLTESARWLALLAQHPALVRQQVLLRERRLNPYSMGRYWWAVAAGGSGCAGPTPGEAVAAHPEVEAITGMMNLLRGSRAQTVQ